MFWKIQEEISRSVPSTTGFFRILLKIERVATLPSKVSRFYNFETQQNFRTSLKTCIEKQQIFYSKNFVKVRKMKMPKMAKQHFQQPVYRKSVRNVTLPLPCCLFASITYTNKSKCLNICEIEKYQPVKEIFDIFKKNLKRCYFTVGRHRNFKLSGMVTVHGSFQKLASLLRNLLHYCSFHLHLVRVTNLRNSQTKQQNQ